MRFRLRTLLIIVAIVPPALAAAWFGAMSVVPRPNLRARQDENEFVKLINDIEKMERSRTPQDNPNGIIFIEGSDFGEAPLPGDGKGSPKGITIIKSGDRAVH